MPVQALIAAPTAFERESSARGFVAERLTYETFQKPDDIARILSQIGIQRLCTTAFGRSGAAVTTTLSLIVHRRNQIVHQCDRDTATPGTLLPITQRDALDAIKHVARVVRGIERVR